MVRSVTVNAAQVATVVSLVLMATVAGAQGEGGASLSLEVSVGEPAAETAAPSSEVNQHLENLQSDDPVARLEAVRALGTLADPASVEPLIRVAQNDPRPEIRGWAIRALNRIGTPEAIAAVRQAAEDDEDERVRGLASQLGASAPAAQAVTPPSIESAPTTPPPTYSEPPMMPGSPVSGEVLVQTVPGQPPQVVLMPQEVTPGHPFMGMRRHRRPGRGLRVGGWVLFGTSYFVSLMAGVGISVGAEDGDDGWPLMIPLVGPAIMGARIIDDNDGFTPFGALAIVWSIVEVAGLTMAVAGHLRGRRARRQMARRQIAIVPSGPGGPGMSLAGTF